MNILDEPIFVCGAPRSGTTLLVSLLDGHESVVALPFEPTITEDYSRYRRLGDEALLDYFLRDYLSGHGVQSIINADYLNFLKDRAERRFGADTQIPRVAEMSARHVERFKRTYRDMLLESCVQDGVPLAAPHRALAAAYIQFTDAASAGLFVQRRPFINEAQAVRLKRAFPGARFIHILRDPRTRYVSAKQRQTYRSRLGLLRVANVSGVDAATHRAAVSMASFELAARNQEVLGEAAYSIVKFEDLIADRRNAMGGIAEFLGIEFSDILLAPTRGGQATSPNSSFKEDTAELAAAAETRANVFRKRTSQLERWIISYYCAAIANQFGYDLDVHSHHLSWRKLQPIRHEDPLDYVRNRMRSGSIRILGQNNLYLRNREFDRLLAMVEDGNAPRM